jgi:hypothetical protein
MRDDFDQFDFAMATSGETRIQFIVAAVEMVKLPRKHDLRH